MTPAPPLLDDATVDAIIDGDPVPRVVDHLAAFAAGVRAAGERQPPRPSPELAALLQHGAPAVANAPTTELPRRTPRRSVLAKVAGLSLAAKVTLGATAAAAGVLGAGAAGVLPGGADRVVRVGIEMVTPVEFTDHVDRVDDPDHGPNPGETDTTEAPSLPGEHGDRVSSDATGKSDGEPGVDGPTVAEQAPGAANRPADVPARSGEAPPAGGPQVTPGGPGDTPGASPPSTTPPAHTAPEAGSPAEANATGGAPSPTP